MYSLKDVLSDQHLHYWQSFVLACRLLCKPCITKTDLMLADCKLLHFVKEYEKINGELAVTPNMHLHLHLKECVQNYGSIYGFWLFSFESYNGVLGSYHTNNKTVEIQIMRKFMTSGILGSLGSVYSTLYPKITEASLNLAKLHKKYRSLSVGGERYGSTAGFRLCPYAHIIALWCGDNGGINPGMETFIRHFIVHSVEIDGKQAIHAFAVVNWLRLSQQDFGFGNPLSVWYARNFEDSGPAVFLPLQRIHSKFLFACKLYSGQQYLICSPICMRILFNRYTVSITNVTKK